MTVGSGDAFGSGGRFQTCIALAADEVDAPSVLLDCGATSLTALRQQQVDPLQIEAVLFTQLHGDHFGGLPFLVLDAQFRRRTRDLTVFGPPGTRTRLEQAMEVLFPGSSSAAPLRRPRRRARRPSYGRTGRAARHPVRGAPCLRRTDVRVARRRARCLGGLG